MWESVVVLQFPLTLPSLLTSTKALSVRDICCPPVTFISPDYLIFCNAEDRAGVTLAIK